MARTRIPNYIARKTGWKAILNWWFVCFFAIEGFLLLCHFQALPISLGTVTLLGMELGRWTIIFAAWTFIFLVAMIWTLVIIRCDYVEFYDSYAIHKKGVIFRTSVKHIFPQVVKVKTRRTFLGFGDVIIDAVGPWDIDLTSIKRPEDVREYLVDHMVNSVAVENIGNNPYLAVLNQFF